MQQKTKTNLRLNIFESLKHSGNKSIIKIVNTAFSLKKKIKQGLL